MHEHLFDRVNVVAERTNVPNGMEPDADKECKRYEELIASLGGVDLQLLGLGLRKQACEPDVHLHLPSSHLQSIHDMWSAAC